MENVDSRTPFTRKINDGSPYADHVSLLELESEGESCGIDNYSSVTELYIIYGRGEGECLDLDL